MLNKSQKLETLADAEGFDSVDAMLEKSTYDSIASAICVNEGCDYTTDMEPDQREGWCEMCETNTVQSCLILAEIL